MLEIDEMMPFYICEGSKDVCYVNGKLCWDECHHTTLPVHVKNEESIDIFNKFSNTFHVAVDDMGRLVCFEKEKK